MKTSAEEWVEAARAALIRDGIANVKVDRLATVLGVTRGGFYHNFRDRDDLLARLLETWARTCQFFPREEPRAEAGGPAGWIERAIARLIDENGYDSRLDMAVREWARTDERAARAVAKADRQRLAALQRVFEALGCDRDEAAIRSRVLYYHQIGYYAVGVKQTTAERHRLSGLYLRILCGERLTDAPKRATRRRVRG